MGLARAGLEFRPPPSVVGSSFDRQLSNSRMENKLFRKGFTVLVDASKKGFCSLDPSRAA
jgi:hypothetical protein